MSAAVELAKLVKELLDHSSAFPSAIEIDFGSVVDGDIWAKRAGELADQILEGAK